MNNTNHSEQGKRKVIIVTDGDLVAKEAVETAARNVGARCISLSAGNPTEISGPEAVNLIMQTPYDPVVLMVDDRGHTGFGKGEQVLKYVAKSPEVDVLGVVAVASNTPQTKGINIDESLTREGRIVNRPVDKEGQPEAIGNHHLEGDTVDILSTLEIGTVIGLGDIGKMGHADDVSKGAPVTTKAFREILERSGFSHAGNYGPQD